MMCELHGVTRAGFYAWRKRQFSQRQQADDRLLERVRQIHADSRGFYGSPRVAGQLRLEGEPVGKRRVARLMRQAGLQGRSARLYRHSKVLQRAFYAGVPYRPESASTQRSDQVWVGDVTYLKVAGQWRYMAAVMGQLQRLGRLQSMNRPGKMNDNAHMESFFHSMKCEELYGKKFDTEQQLRSTLRSYIHFYNERRLHSSLQYLPPAAFERGIQGATSVN
jgi:putative transposase